MGPTHVHKVRDSRRQVQKGTHQMNVRDLWPNVEFPHAATSYEYKDRHSQRMFPPHEWSCCCSWPSVFLTELSNGNSWPECCCRAEWHKGEYMSTVDTYSTDPNPTVFQGTEVLVTEGSQDSGKWSIVWVARKYCFSLHCCDQNN